MAQGICQPTTPGKRCIEDAMLQRRTAERAAQSKSQAVSHRSLKGCIACKAQVGCYCVEGPVDNSKVVAERKGTKASNGHSPDDWRQGGRLCSVPDIC